MLRHAVVLLMFAAVLLQVQPAAAEPQWAPIDQATVTPGVQTFTSGAQCTANFVFYDATDVYIGQAAHCSGTGASTDTNGCIAESLPVNTPVEVTGAGANGTMVYNSWLAMQAAGEDDPDTCAYNDFALIRLDPADHGSVNPSLPSIGGPTGLNTAGTATGDFIYSYGNSSLRFGLTPFSPKVGLSLGSDGNGWNHPHYAITPGIPGDSGSAFLDSEGRALGVLSTLAIAPLALSNNASDISRALDYMESHGGPNVTLALGTEPFTPPV